MITAEVSNTSVDWEDAFEQELLAAKNLIETDKFALRGKSLISLADFDKKQIAGVLRVTAAMHAAYATGAPMFKFRTSKSLAMIFEKPSLRTRVTFDLGMRQLGGLTVLLGPNDIVLGKRESVPDVARNLERWVDVVMARVFEHEKLTGLRDNSHVPIINALSDFEHPCQILADLYTLQRHRGSLKGFKLAWVGDGNNVLHSLMYGCAMCGVSLTAACPKGYWPDPAVIAYAQQLANGCEIDVIEDPVAAVKAADAVYTDAWASMGQEAEAELRRNDFAAYQVNSDLLKHAQPDALFMHCLPAHRGEEVTDEVLDGPQCVVLDQAENRLHAQKAVLALLVGP